eukprot:GHVT01086705.1.p2 GENE.GHVT01086705.1~~GHVT01086705.1.p2  ORF type:complete len:108 (-),score=25.45 GHVT01086705.1:190-513(-)
MLRAAGASRVAPAGCVRAPTAPSTASASAALPLARLRMELAGEAESTSPTCVAFEPTDKPETNRDKRPFIRSNVAGGIVEGTSSNITRSSARRLAQWLTTPQPQQAK